MEDTERSKRILQIKQKLVKILFGEACQFAIYKTCRSWIWNHQTQIHLVAGRRIWTQDLRIINLAPYWTTWPCHLHSLLFVFECSGHCYNEIFYYELSDSKALDIRHDTNRKALRRFFFVSFCSCLLSFLFFCWRSLTTRARLESDQETWATFWSESQRDRQ